MREHLYPSDYHIINVQGGVFLDDAIVDFDDWQPTAMALPYLDQFKQMFPNFKVTLFAIPGRFIEHQALFEEYEKRKEWVQLAVHGWQHADNYEASRWSKEVTVYFLNEVERMFPFFVKGFKAPGWQISDGCYQGLLEKGYWVADQSYNDERRPKELKAYTTAHPWIVHGHTWDMGYAPFNGIGQIIRESRFPFKAETKFHWISEIV